MVVQALSNPTRLLSTIVGDLFPLPESDEERLAALASTGDRSAFCELLRRSQGAVYGLCLRLLGNRDWASDAAQEAFVRAYASLASFDPEQRFEIWVLRIARNHCYDLLRRQGHRPACGESATEALADSSPSAHERLEQAEISRDLESALAELSPEDREVLSLYYVQNRRTREIGRIMGVAPGTVMARLFRARQRLRKQLSEVDP
jgi:RNA polymerase sigma-70 factor (ECF subfamily)